MAPKWQDQFDFDDLDEQPKNKDLNKKKKPAADEDFFDLDDLEDKKPQTKLPVINNKREGLNVNVVAKDKNSRNKDPLTEKINNADFDKDEFQDDFGKSSQKQSKKANENYERKNQPKNNYNSYDSGKKAINSKGNGKQKESDEQYFEEIDDIKFEQPKQVKKQQIISNTSSKKQQSQHNDYGQDFQQDAYGEDFQEPVQQAKKPQSKGTKGVQKANIKKLQRPPIKKSSAEISRVNKAIKVGEKPQSRKQNLSREGEASRNLSVNKTPLKRSNSRHSDRSRSAVSRGKTTNASVFIPNKYAGLVDKNFPDSYDPQKESEQKLAKSNDRIRGMIKNLNDELNDLINKNMLLMKAKKNQRVVTVDDRIRVLQEQIKNNETTIYRMQGEFDKLRGRQGELKEQQYQIIVQRNINQIKQKIKQTQKENHKLKVSVNNDGNKLSKEDKDKKVSQQLHNIKTLLVNAKRDDQKGTQKLQKLDEKIQDLGIKISDLEYQIKEKIDSAKDKGIKIQNRDQIIKKHQDLKKKHENLRNHNSKLQSLMKSKAQIIEHENEQIRISIRNCESEIKNLYVSISHSHQQSVKIVQNAKYDAKVSASIHSTLDAILKSLEQSSKDDLESRSNASRAQSHRPFQKKRTSAIENREKSTPGKPLSKKQPISNKDIVNRQNQKIQSKEANASKEQNVSNPVEVNNKKPNFTRKKNNESFQQKNQQRVWKEQQKKKSQPVPPIQQKKQQDKKKPFSLKRNRLDQNKQKSSNQIILPQQIKVKQKKQQETQKPKEDSSIVGPRMMKFNRKKNQNQQDENSKNYGENNDLKITQQPKLKINNDLKIVQQPKLKINEKKQQKNEQINSIIAPKRFNLRNKIQKKDDSYNPTVVEKKQPQKINEQYKPNFNFKQQYKAAQPLKKQNQFKTSEQINLSKPMLNLRLKDRKKQNQDTNEGYMPTIASNKNVDKIEEENTNQYVPMRVRNNSNNPYGLSKESGRKQQNADYFQPKKEENKNLYNPSVKKEEKNIYAPKQSDFKLPNSLKEELKQNNPPKEQVKNLYAPKQEKNNPYAQKEQIKNPYVQKEQVRNPYAQKEQVKNLYAQKQEINNPYAPTQNQPVRQRQGRIKKQKINPNVSKQKINIYEQAQDLTGIKQIGGRQEEPMKNIVKDPIYQPKKQEVLDLNAMLGINKNKKKSDDLDDLLSGGTKVDTKKNKKRADDFFNDMDF